MKNFETFLDELQKVDAPSYIPYPKENLLDADPETKTVMVGFYYLWYYQGAELKELHRAWFYKDGDPDNFKEGAYVVFVEMLPGDRKDEGFLFIGRREDGYIKELVNTRIYTPQSWEEFEEEVQKLVDSPVSIYS